MKTALSIVSAVLAFSSSAHADDDDPMLAPIPPAADVIPSWNDAIVRIQHAPDLLSSAADVDRVTAQRRIALAAVLPQLSAVGEYQHAFRDQGIPANTWSIAGVATWTLDARAIHAVGTADAQIDLSRLSLAEQKRELVSATITGMLATLTAERISELDRSSLRAALDRHKLTQGRLAFAHGIELDVDRAQQDVESARSQLVQADETMRQTREALGLLVGSSTPIAAASGLDIEGFEKAIATTCRPTADIEHRADVATARQRVDIAERAITDAELRFVPTLGVTSQTTDANVVSFGPTANWIVSATITVPLYDGGARYGAMRQARVERDQAQLALTQTRAAAIVDAARADRAIGVSVETRDVSKRERDLAAQVDSRVRQGYAAGLGTSLDLVTSAQALRQAEIELATAEFQVARARAGAVLAHAECVL
jgi:outer membrane protein, multidrug efflux system